MDYEIMVTVGLVCNEYSKENVPRQSLDTKDWFAYYILIAIMSISWSIGRITD